MKVFFSSLAAAFIISMSLGGLSAHAATAQFTKNLTVGSTGAQVTQLQQFLINAGYSTQATGYFGSLTKAAVGAYQKSQNISPDTGYFGPLTRATINTSLVVMPVVSTPIIPVVSVASTTPQSGVVHLSLAPTPATNSYIYTSINAPVYSLQFQVSGGPVTLNRFDLQVQDYQGDTVGTGAENPGAFVNVVKMWDGQNIIGSWNVTPAQFIQTGTDSSIYYLRLAGLNYSLPAGTSTDLTITFGTTGGNDIDHTIVLQGYTGESGTNLAVTTGGASNYYGADGTQFKVTQIFKGRTMPIVSMTGDPSYTPGYGNYIVDSSNGLMGADMSLVDVESQDGDIFITDFTANVTASGTPPTNISLYDTAISTTTSVASASPTGLSGSSGVPVTGSVSFHNLHLPVVANSTIQLDLQADMPGGITEGTNVSVGDTNTAITYQTDFGSSVTLANASAGLYPSYFYTAAPTFTLVSASATTTARSNTGSTQALSATFVVSFEPTNSDMEALSASDITVDASKDFINFPNVPNVSVDVSPAPTGGVYSRGQTYTATINATASNSDLPDTGSYMFYLDGLNWSMTNGVSVNPNYFFGNLLYDTNAVSFVK